MGLWSSKPRPPVVVDDLDPVVEWKLQAGDDRDVVEIYLPGFKKEQVRVLVDDYGVMSAAGERPARGGGTRWERFRKDIRLPDNCDVRGVRAEFVEKLVITLPIVPAPKSPESETTLPSPSFSPPPPPPARPRPPVYPDEPPPPPLSPSPPLSPAHTAEPSPSRSPSPPLPPPPPPPPPPPYFKPPPRRRSSRPPVTSYPLPPPSRHPLPPAPPPTYSDLSPSSAPLKPIAATEPATSQSPPAGTPADTTEPKQPAALLERKISIASSPPRGQEGEAPKKQLQDGKMPEEDDGGISKPSSSSPEEEDRRKKGREDTGVEVMRQRN